MMSERWLGEQKEEAGAKMRREGREKDLGLKWVGEHVDLCVVTERWEGLKKVQVLEMEEYEQSHERAASQ